MIFGTKYESRFCLGIFYVSTLLFILSKKQNTEDKEFQSLVL